MKRNLIGLISAFIILTGSYLVDAPDIMNQKCFQAIAFMISFLIILISEAIPILVVCILYLGLLPVLGITGSLNEALTGFSNQVVFFIFSSFGLATAINSVPLSRRFLKKVMCTGPRNVERIIFSVLFCTMCISAFISNVPTCAASMSVGLEFLNLYQEEEAKKKTGKALMIGIPIASMIGGMITPVGSSINIMTIDLLEKYTGKTIMFGQWTIIGLPLAAITFLVSWFILKRIYKIAPLEESCINQFIDSIQVPKKMTFEEKKVLLISGIMLVLWLSSSWIKNINIMVVSLLGCCAFCMPFIGVISTEKLIKSVSWDAIILVGTVLSFSTVLVNTGASDLITHCIPAIQVPLPVFLMYIAAIMFLFLIIIPVAPSLIAMIIPSFIAMASTVHVEPTIVALVCGLCASNCYLLPLDTVCMITFGKGYYKMTDMMKGSVLIQIAFIILVSAFTCVGTLIWH